MKSDLKFLKASQCLLEVELTVALIDGAPVRPLVLIYTTASLITRDVFVNWLQQG